jgi:hypothetical protein
LTRCGRPSTSSSACTTTPRTSGCCTTATFLAVLVLALARLERIRIAVSAGHRQLVTAGNGPPFPGLLVVTIRNVGSRRAAIKGIGWRRRPWRRLHGYQQFDPTGRDTRPPVGLEPGDARSLSPPSPPLSHTEMQWGEDFVRHFVGRWPQGRCPRYSRNRLDTGRHQVLGVPQTQLEAVARQEGRSDEDR